MQPTTTTGNYSGTNPTCKLCSPSKLCACAPLWPSARLLQVRAFCKCAPSRERETERRPALRPPLWCARPEDPRHSNAHCACQCFACGGHARHLRPRVPRLLSFVFVTFVSVGRIGASLDTHARRLRNWTHSECHARPPSRSCVPRAGPPIAFDTAHRANGGASGQLPRRARRWLLDAVRHAAQPPRRRVRQCVCVRVRTCVCAVGMSAEG